jgi:hypothetical protein
MEVLVLLEALVTARLAVVAVQAVWAAMHQLATPEVVEAQVALQLFLAHLKHTLAAGVVVLQGALKELAGVVLALADMAQTTVVAPDFQVRLVAQQLLIRAVEVAGGFLLVVAAPGVLVLLLFPLHPAGLVIVILVQMWCVVQLAHLLFYPSTHLVHTLREHSQNY